MRVGKTSVREMIQLYSVVLTPKIIGTRSTVAPFLLLIRLEFLYYSAVPLSYSVSIAISGFGGF